MSDMAEAARRVVASGPPMGVTWRHPGESRGVVDILWRHEHSSVLSLGMPQKQREAFLRDVWAHIQATNEDPECVAAQNLQCRMAALHPTWSARPALFFEV